MAAAHLPQSRHGEGSAIALALEHSLRASLLSLPSHSEPSKSCPNWNVNSTHGAPRFP